MRFYGKETEIVQNRIEAFKWHFDQFSFDSFPLVCKVSNWWQNTDLDGLGKCSGEKFEGKEEALYQLISVSSIKIGECLSHTECGVIRHNNNNKITWPFLKRASLNPYLKVKLPPQSHCLSHKWEAEEDKREWMLTGWNHPLQTSFRMFVCPSVVLNRAFHWK